MKRLTIFFQRSNEGFTVIELLVVFSITGVLSVLSFASFFNFNDAQSLQSAALDVSTMLTVAKSRSVSQVKPTNLCRDDQALDGYEMKATGTTYELRVKCGGFVNSSVITIKNLPDKLEFPSTTTVLFEVGTGNVSSPSVITIEGYGKRKLIQVDNAGSISVNEGFSPPITPPVIPTSTPTPIPDITLPTNTPTPTPGLDAIPPTAPTNLSGQVINDNQININWTASTDNVGVVRYLIYRNGVGIGVVNSPTTFYSNTGLTPNTTYQYYIRAMDARNNQSTQSNTVSFTTSEPNPECSDGIDNDGDGGLDYPDDQECVDGEDDSEAIEGKQ